jgi:asparagine synthetase B (glutamine-hydrolysing)
MLSTGALIAARDDVAPLFFADAKDELLLSWSTEALVSQPHVSSDVNRVASPTTCCIAGRINRDLFLGREPGAPGHVLEVDRTGRRLRRYWDPATEETTPWLRMRKSRCSIRCSSAP